MDTSHRNNTDVLTLVQLTDTHLTASDTALRGIDTGRTLAAVIKRAAGWIQRADHLVLTGDLTHDGLVSSAERLRASLVPFRVPYSYLPGNHDDPANLDIALGGSAQNWPRVVSIKGWRLILLNSHRPGHEGGEIGVEQLERLNALLLNESDTPTLVAVHHHPAPVGSPWLDAIALADGAALLKQLGKFPQVRGLLFGHVHQEIDIRIGSLRLIGSPSTCMQFEPRSETAHSDRRLPGFRWLVLKPDGEVLTGVERIGDWPGAQVPQV